MRVANKDQTPGYSLGLIEHAEKNLTAFDSEKQAKIAAMREEIKIMEAAEKLELRAVIRDACVGIYNCTRNHVGHYYSHLFGSVWVDGERVPGVCSRAGDGAIVLGDSVLVLYNDSSCGDLSQLRTCELKLILEALKNMANNLKEAMRYRVAKGLAPADYKEALFVPEVAPQAPANEGTQTSDAEKLNPGTPSSCTGGCR